MARYARGKWSKAQDDRTGFKVRYKDLRTEWTGVRVHKSEWEPKHPQLTPPRRINDPQALSNPRPDTTQVDAEVNYNYRYANEPINATFSNGWYVGNSNFGIEVEDFPEGNLATLFVSSVTPENETFAASQEILSVLNSVIPEAEIIPTSALLTGSVGTPTLDFYENAEGSSGSVVSGTVTPEAITEAVSQLLTSFSGTVAIDLYPQPAGEEMMANLGTVIPQTYVFVNGQQINSQLASVAIEQPGWGNNAWSIGTWGQ